MQTDHDPKLGRVPDSRLDRHGGVATPKRAPHTADELKGGTLLDDTLSHILPVKRVFES